PSGVTRSSKTTSGGASMSMDVTKSGTVPRCLLGGRLQRGEPVGPEALDELAHDVEPVDAHHEQVAGALPGLRDETGTVEHTEVVGHGLLAHRHLRGDLADGPRG